MNFDKIIDLFMFREGSDDDNDSQNPVVTTGSIVWGVMFRLTIVVLLTFMVLSRYDWHEYWWFAFFVVWFFVAYPAYRQYINFSRRMETFEEETLCGTCRHFNSGSQMCTIYDEHVSKTYIPCEGQSWEPK